MSFSPLFSALSLLSVASVAVAQNTSTADPASIVSSVCANANGSPACEMFATCRTLNNCDPLAYALLYCKSAPSNPLCSALNARCSATPNDCRLVAFLDILPTAANVSGLVYSICTEMPMMANCNKCPNPDPTTRVSNCPVFRNYADLCLEMPGMGQCAAWKSFCGSVNNRTNFCNASEPTAGSGIANSTVGTSPTPSPNTRNGDISIQATGTFMSLLSITATLASLALMGF